MSYDQSAEIEALKAENAALKAEIQMLKAENLALKERLQQIEERLGLTPKGVKTAKTHPNRLPAIQKRTQVLAL